MAVNTPLPVKGYTTQSDDNVALANEGKELEERYLRWLDKLDGMAKTTTHGFDARFIALARTHVQTGAMFAIRSIFRPTRIMLPEDA
ncbi:MAG: hypothetical protein IPL32_18430 [Chloracidobacterium sp.]|nr:hypothetical protein [Chloracidobacterium sp.]